MRPYRGLTKEGKKVYGWYYIKHRHLTKLRHIISEPHPMGSEHEVIPETVGQFVTKDKNGNDVYAGDNATGIVFIEDSPPYRVISGKVKYYKASFCIVSNCTYYQINDLLDIELIERINNGKQRI